MKKRVSGKGRELIGGKGSKHSHNVLCVCMKLLKSKKIIRFFFKKIWSLGNKLKASGTMEVRWSLDFGDQRQNY